MVALGSLLDGWRPVAAGLALAGGREVVVLVRVFVRVRCRSPSSRQPICSRGRSSEAADSLITVGLTATRPILAGDQLTTNKEANVSYCNSCTILEVIRRSERLSGAHPSTLVLLLVPSRSYVTDRPSYLCGWFVTRIVLRAIWDTYVVGYSNKSFPLASHILPYNCPISQNTHT